MSKQTVYIPIPVDDNRATEYATGMMGLGEYNEKWDYADKVMFNTIVRAVRYGQSLLPTSPATIEENNK